MKLTSRAKIRGSELLVKISSFKMDVSSVVKGRIHFGEFIVRDSLDFEDVDRGTKHKETFLIPGFLW